MRTLLLLAAACLALPACQTNPYTGDSDLRLVSDAEILDLVLSTALFGWANRLMHVLGDPVRPETGDD